MNNEFDTYQQLAMRTAKAMSREHNLIHAALGLTGEAGEFADCIKKNFVYGRELDRENAAEELGDILWFVALACDTLGVSMSDVAGQNIAKLRKRYPTQYQDELAAFRADKQQTIEA